MRFGSEELQNALMGPTDNFWLADLYYNGVRRQQDLPIIDPKFKEDAGANIQQSGSVTVTWSDEFATSLSPQAMNDPLAPFGAQLAIYSMVTAGPFIVSVEYGRF